MVGYFIYSDINENLNTNYVYDFSSITQGIMSILTTPKGTRFFNADYGSNIESILFEPMTIATQFLLYVEISNAIYQWEPRVRVNEGLSSVQLDYDNHIYIVTLVFDVVGLTTVTKTTPFIFGLAQEIGGLVE